MEDWNVVAPVLYLWSRPDWTAKHKAIAQKRGHLCGERGNKVVRDSSFKKKQKINNAMKGKKTNDATGKQKINNDAVVTDVADSAPQLHRSEVPKETASGGITEDLESPSACNNHNKGEKHANDSRGNSKDNKGSLRKRRHIEEKHQVGRSVENVSEHKRWRSSPSNNDHRGQHSSYSGNPHHGGPRHTPVNSRLSLEEGYSIRQGPPSNVSEMGDPGYKQVDSVNYEASYGRGRHDMNQVGYYRERVGNYHEPESDPYLSADPYLSVRDRYPIDTRPRPGGFESAYLREPEGYSFNQLPPSEPEPRYTSTYSMESTYSYMPATERYNLRLDEQNRARASDVSLHMAHAAEVGPYNYQAPGPRYPSDQTGFRPAPYNPYLLPHNLSIASVNFGAICPTAPWSFAVCAAFGITLECWCESVIDVT